MADDILQAFLNRGLFNIGAEDARLGYFKAAATALSQTLSDQHTRVVPSVLTALDPDVPVDDPIIIEAETALKEQWKTYRNAYSDTPRQLLRAVILEALRLAGSSDPVVAGAAWLTGSSVLPYHRLGREEEVIRSLLAQFGAEYDASAQEGWGVTVARLPALKIAAPTIPPLQVDIKYLRDRLGAAVGPNNDQSVPYAAPVNNTWSNSAPAWSYQFMPIASDAVAQSINSAMAAVVKHTGAAVQASSTQLAAAITEISKALNGTHQGIARRTHLLWWREALYSPSAQCSYRSLTAIPAALLMACDLATETGPITPRSVECVLREAVRELIGSSTKARPSTIGAIVAQAFGAEKPDKGQAALRKALGATPELGGGRLSLLGIMQRAAAGDAPESIAAALGVGGEESLTLPDAAVWLFRDCQAAHLVAAAATEGTPS